MSKRGSSADTVLIDPVSGFVYPKQWTDACTNQALLESVRAGLAILTASGTILIRGYTTGTTAAAACKAAVLSLKTQVDEVNITIPAGLTLMVRASGREGRGQCRKFSGDYPSDATSGLLFVAYAEPDKETILHAGEGIGRWKRDTPRFMKGDPAISLSARDEICMAIKEAEREIGITGVRVSLFAPDGIKTALHTLNEKVGVIGGISVLGSTGLVEPWDDHLEASVFQRIADAKKPVLTTGRIGMRYARLLFPDNEVILVGSHIGPALLEVSAGGILCGLPGLILKYMNPDFLLGTLYQTVEEMVPHPVFRSRMEKELHHFAEKWPDIKVVIVNRDGTVIGETP